MKSITLLSPAKVNLTFEILGKREDGYHEIRSIMQPINMFDEIYIEVNEGDVINLKSKGIKIPEGEENLAVKAANLFVTECELEKHINISINKKIPIGGGLGGGSGNAAAVLVGLNRLLQIFSDDELKKLSPKLGADVAFFLNSLTSFVEGIGEKITPLPDFPLLHYVVLYPRFQVSTKDIYEKWDEMNLKNQDQKSKDNLNQIKETFLAADNKLPLFSDLEPPALALYPELKSYRDLMQSMDAGSVLICGSGSSVFAAFKDEEPAKDLFNYLECNELVDTFLANGIHGWHRIAD